VAELYSCPACGSTDVEICFIAWVPANDMENRARWTLDTEAQPEEDSNRCWCPTCEDMVLPRKTEPGSEVGVGSDGP
jgi:hypothetical protein